MKQILEQLELHYRFLQQERDVERDWNQVTSVCLTLQFPEKDSAIGMGQIVIQRQPAFLMAHVPDHL